MHGKFQDDEEEFRNDPLVRIAATIMDPRYGEPVPPTSVTAGQLLERAKQQQRRTTLRRLTWLGAPSLVAILVVVILAAADFFSGARHVVPVTAPLSHAPARAPQPPPVPLHLSSGTALAARPQLVALVARTRARADRVAPGRYTYIHNQTWSRRDASSGPSGQSGVRDEQLWWAADRSGRQVVAEASAVPTAGAPAATTGAPAYGAVSDYRPGELAVVVGSPSVDPAILASQLADYQPFTEGPQAPLRAVVQVYRYHALDAAHRAAAIRVLADTTGLRYRGQVTDPAGRTGIAISVDSDRGATRDVAVFDPATGQLLCYERDALRRSGDAVVEYVLFLGAGRTDELGEPVTAGTGTG
jgi:hypothetical protein